MADDSLKLIRDALVKYQGVPIPEHLIDYIYVIGYMSDRDYRDYYMDTTRMKKPKLRCNRAQFPASLVDQCDRIEIKETKNVLLYEAQIMKDLFE